MEEQQEPIMAQERCQREVVAFSVRELGPGRGRVLHRLSRTG